MFVELLATIRQLPEARRHNALWWHIGYIVFIAMRPIRGVIQDVTAWLRKR